MFMFLKWSHMHNITIWSSNDMNTRNRGIDFFPPHQFDTNNEKDMRIKTVEILSWYSGNGSLTEHYVV